jgi:hypothetical protein
MIMSTINARLKEAIAAIKAGNKQTGRGILESVLEDDPENEAALLWMTKVVDTPAQQQVYVDRVLYVNPDNEPAQKLQAQLAKSNRASEIIRPLPGPDFDQLVIPQPLIIKSATNPTLTFNDGLNFGCGFFVAGLLFSLAMIPLSFFIVSVLVAMGR